MLREGLNQFEIFSLSSLGVIYWGIAVFSEGLVGIGSKHRLVSVILMNASATLFDGIALMWFSILYENRTIRKTNPPATVVISRMGAA